jgi:hypothetical protein
MAFLKRENLQVLWDVIIEDDFIRGRPRQELQWINKMFNDSVQGFYQHNRNKSNLVDLNKNFISLMMRTIETNFQNQTQQQQQKVLYTSEEIANEKKTQFDLQLKERQNAFHNSMTQHIPAEPNFKDPHDGPIANLDVEMKKLMAMRNYEVQSYPQPSGNEPSNWLQPVETSVKAEKLSRQPTSLNNSSQQSQNQGRTSARFNTIQIGSELNDDKNEVIDLETSPKKSVAWSEDLESVTPHFFSKLKKTSQAQAQISSEENITFELKEELPEVTSLKESQYDELKREINQLHKKLDLILNHLSSPASASASVPHSLHQPPTLSNPSLSPQLPAPLALSDLLF